MIYVLIVSLKIVGRLFRFLDMSITNKEDKEAVKGVKKRQHNSTEEEMQQQLETKALGTLHVL